MEALSPHAFRMIEKGMKSAQDSLAYYEYYIRKAKVYELSTTPDSSVPIVANTIALPIGNLRRHVAIHFWLSPII